MPHRRKVFRIEEMYLATQNGGADAMTRAADRTRDEIEALRVGGLTASAGELRQELDAVVGSADQSVQRILSAAEDIDEAANTLLALLAREQDQALARAIR